MKKISAALSACAALMGACGIAAAAGAAHAAGAEKLSSVALILLVHATALLALTLRDGKLWLVGAGLMALGATLFSLDVTLHTLQGVRLFPMAAPTGGSTLIIAWLLVAAAAIVDFRAGTLP